MTLRPSSKISLTIAVLLLGAAAILVVAAPWDRGERPGEQPPAAGGAAAAEPSTAAAGVKSAEVDAAAAGGAERAVAGGGAARTEVEARTLVSGTFRAPAGIWPGGGTAELHPVPAQPGGGFMGFLSEMTQQSRSAQRRAPMERAEKGTDPAAGPDAAAGRDARERGRGRDEFLALFGRTEPVASAVLDPRGGFAFADPPAGRYQLLLRHPHLGNRDEVEAEVVEGTHRDLGDLETRASGSLLVLVSDSEGRPVEGARLELARKIDMNRFMDPAVLEDMTGLMRQFVPREDRTDRRGACRFERLGDTETWTVSVEADSLAEQQREVRVLAGRDNLCRVELSTGALLEVRVTGPDGAASAGVLLRVRFPDFQKQTTEFRFGTPQVEPQKALQKSLVTDGDGFARRGGLPAGRAEVELVTPGFLRTRQELVLETGRTATAELRLDPGLSVSGRVVDEDGQPVADAHVMHLAMLGQEVLGMDVSSFVGIDMLSLGIERRGVPVAADGRFTLGGFEKGQEAHLIAAARGFDAATADGVPVGTEDVELRLLRSTTVSGVVVTDPGGEPVPGFEVRLEQRAWLVMDRPIATEQFEGRADGSFVVEAVPRQRFKLVVEAAGRAAHSVSVDCSDGPVDLGRIGLKLPAAIEGITVDPDGRPVPGVAVRVARGGPLDSHMMSKFFGTDAYESDEDGHFRIDGLTGSRVRLLADKDGFAPLRSATITLEEGRTTGGVVLALGHGGSLHGVVVDAEGRPLEGWRVQAALASGAGLRFGASDAGGEFLLEGLAAGTYKVDALPGDYMERVARTGVMSGRDEDSFDFGALMSQTLKWTVSERVVVRDDERAEIELRFEADEGDDPGLVAVEGKVRVGGLPLEAGMVSFVQPGATMPTEVASVHDGTFRLDRVAPGPYQVQVQAGMFAGRVGRSTEVRVTSESPCRVELDLPGGQLSGRAVHGEDGQPAAGVVLSLSSAADAGSAFDRVDIGEGTVLTDGDGRFSFDGLAAGTYEVFAKELLLQGGAGRSGRLGGIVLGDGERRTDLSLALKPGGSLDVHVRDGAGPRSNALVTLLRPDGKPIDLLHRALTDPDGAVSFQGVPEGDYRVSVDAPKAAPAVSGVVRVDPGLEGRLDVVLDRGVPVRLRLEGELPDSARGELVVYSIWRGDGSLLRAGRLLIPRERTALEAAARTGIELGSLEPGRYRLRLENARFGTAELEREVPGSGDAAAWALDLAALMRRAR